ncbi:PAS domain S-box protein [Thermodesulfobacteriota bacterium]
MKKIFIVDNDLIFLKLMKKFLKNEGHQVKTAIDGLEALDVLKNYTPEVMFIDLVMPNIDGETLCRIIRGMEKFKDAYLIILSAISAEESVDIAKFGANACIAKGPFDEMSQHILATLDQPESTSSRCLSGKVLGIEAVYPRGITKELLSAKRHSEVILEKMIEGIFEMSAEGRIVYANPAALSMTQIPLKHLLGSHFVDLFSGDDHRRISDLMKMTGVKTITDESPVFLTRAQVTLNILPLDKPETSAIIIMHDVTKRKQAEDALKSAREYAQNIIDSSLDMIISVDNDRRIVEFNQAAETAFGYRKEEVVGKSVNLLYADIEEGRELRETALKREDYIGEIENIRKDGNTFTTLLSIAFMRDKEGEVIGSVGVSRDITEQKETQKELEKYREHLEEIVDERTKAVQKSEKRFRELADLLPQTVFELDDSGHITFANRMAFNIFEYTQEDFDKGLNALQMFVPEDRDKIMANIQRVLSGEIIMHIESTAQKKNGSAFPVLIYPRVILHKEEPVGIRGILIDTTSHKKEEEHRRKIEAQLYNARRMATLGKMASGLIDEIIQPLSGIHGYLQLMQLEKILTEQHQKRLQTMLETIDRMSNMMNQFRTISLTSQVQMGLVSLKESVNKTRNLFEHQLRINDIRCSIEFQEGVPAIHGDANGIQQVISNLMINAIHALEDRENGSREILIKAQYRDDTVILDFEDTGCGMSEDVQAQIFDPFFTTKASKEDSGLGMVIVETILHKHEATINLESKVGVGTRFSIEFPVAR